MRILLVLFGVFGGFFSLAEERNLGEKELVFRDPGDYFPWGHEVEFVWRGFQGSWRVTLSTGREVHLWVRPLRHSADHWDLFEVLEYDPLTCAILARGRGRTVDSQVVTVRLQSRAEPSYSINFHCFAGKGGTQDLLRVVSFGQKPISTAKKGYLLQKSPKPARYCGF